MGGGPNLSEKRGAMGVNGFLKARDSGDHRGFGFYKGPVTVPLVVISGFPGRRHTPWRSATRFSRCRTDQPGSQLETPEIRRRLPRIVKNRGWRESTTPPPTPPLAVRADSLDFAGPSRRGWERS